MKTVPRVILIAAFLVLSVVAVLPVSAGHSLSPAVFQSGINSPPCRRRQPAHRRHLQPAHRRRRQPAHRRHRQPAHRPHRRGDEHALPDGNLHAKPAVSAANAYAATARAAWVSAAMRRRSRSILSSRIGRCSPGKPCIASAATIRYHRGPLLRRIVFRGRTSFTPARYWRSRTCRGTTFHPGRYVILACRM